MIPSLLWITPPDGELSFMHKILKRSAETGGVAVLYRRKGQKIRRRLDEARPLRKLCRERGIPFLVQDLGLGPLRYIAGPTVGIQGVGGH